MMVKDVESGFTLIELLVAIVLAGIVSIAIGTALLIGFKTTFATAQTVAQSGNAQLLTQYFPSDVQSSAFNGLNTIAATPTGCTDSPVAGSTNLVRLSWTDTATSKQYAAAYRREGTLIRRYWCELGSAPNISTVSRDVIAASVAISGIRVTATVSVQDPTEYLGPGAYTFSVSGSRRTPGASCSANSESIVISPVPVAVSGGHLSSTVTVTFTTDGVCGAASLDYQYGATSGSSSTVAAATSGPGGTWTAVIPRASDTWTEGTKTILITAGTTTATSTFAVYDPTACVLTSPAPSVSPNPTTVASGVLSATKVSFTTTGTCHGATSGSVTFQYGPTTTDSDTVTAALVTVVGTTQTWEAVLPPTEATGWTAGTKTYTVSTDVASGSGTFTVNPAPVPCSVSAGSVNPASNPSYLSVGQTGSGQLRNPLTVSFATTGSCASASLTYQYGPSATDTATVAATGGPTNWTATIPASAPASFSFSTGTKALTATAGTSTATGSFVVADGCALTTTITFTPNPVSRQGNNLSNNVVAAFSTRAACTSTDMIVRFQYRGTTETTTTAAAAGTPTQNPDGSLNWTATFLKDLGSLHWSSGSKAVSIPAISAATINSFMVNP